MKYPAYFTDMTFTEILQLRYLHRDVFKNEIRDIDLIFWDYAEYRTLVRELEKEFMFPFASMNYPDKLIVFDGCRLYFLDNDEYENITWKDLALFSADNHLIYEEGPVFPTVSFDKTPYLVRKMDDVFRGVNLNGERVCFRKKEMPCNIGAEWERRFYE